MRIGLLLLFLYSFIANTDAENVYRIFKTTEGVTLSNREVDGVTVYKRMEVELGDMLHIPQGGKVAILDSNTKQIYYSNSVGDVRVVKIVVDAKKQADEGITAINRQIEASISERKQSGYTYAVQGATYRGEGVDSQTLQVYAALCQVLEKREVGKEKNMLRLALKGDDMSFHFSLTNLGKKPLFVNVLRLGEKPHVCIQIGHSTGTPYLLLDAESSRETTEISFARLPDAQEEYLLFGSEIPFDSQQLQRLFNEGKRVDNNNQTTIYLSLPIR